MKKLLSKSLICLSLIGSLLTSILPAHAFTLIELYIPQQGASATPECIGSGTNADGTKECKNGKWVAVIQPAPSQPTPSPQPSTLPLNILDTGIQNGIFNPYDGQEAKITFVLNQAAYVTLEIYDDYVTKVVAVQENKFYEKGEYNLGWNGKNTFGDVVSEGKYVYRLIAVDGNRKVQKTGEIIVKKFFVGVDEIETIAPHIKDFYISKDELDAGLKEQPYIVFTTTAQANINVGIYNADNKKLEEILNRSNQVAGIYKVQYDPQNLVNKPGIYTYRILAENSQGYEQKFGQFTIKEEGKEKKKPNIFKDYVSENQIPFNPENQELGITFKLERDSDVTLEIRENDRVIALVMEDQPYVEGQHTAFWDGRDKFGTYAEDGVYQYKLIASNMKGKDTEKGYFSIKNSGEAKHPGGNCNSFADVDEVNPYCEAISWANVQGIFVGYNDGTFKPNQYITRAEALRAVLDALKVKTLEARGESFGFIDLDRFGWYMPHLKTALSLGIVKGYQDQTFRPNQTVTRAEGLTMLLNTGRLRNNLVIPSNNYAQPYYDTPKTAWYIDYVWVAKTYSLNNNDAYFYPDQEMTRGEMADLLYRYHQAGLDQQ